MRRRLGILEFAQMLTDEFSAFNVVMVLRLRNGPQAEDIWAALNILQKQHPLLQVRIQRRIKQCWFESNPDIALDFRHEQRKSEHHWREIAEHELNTRLDSEQGPLMRASYLTSNTHEHPSDLILTFHHSIIDATSGDFFVHSLLQLCERLSRGEEPVDSRPMSLLEPEEAFFPSGFKGLRRVPRILGFIGRQVADEIRVRRGNRGQRKAPIHDSGNCGLVTTLTPAGVTAALINRARRKRLSLYHVCNAALIAATAKQLYPDQNLLCRHFNFADLRPYLKPPVDKEHLGAYHSLMRFTVPVTPDMAFWDFAENIQNIAFEAVKRGDKFLSALLSRGMMSTLLKQKSFRMGTTALSYTGAQQFEKQYGEIEIVDMHAFVSNIVLGPEYTAQARLFDGRLIWGIVYLDVDMDKVLAEKIAQDIQFILKQAID